MAESNYRMQIIDIRSGQVVQWRAGMPIETDLVTDLCERLKSRGVGIFTTQEKVLAAVKEEFAELLWTLKAKTVHNPDGA